MLFDVRRAILESQEEVIGSFAVQWNHEYTPPRGQLQGDPGSLAALFDRLYSLTAEGLGTVAIRFIDDNGSFVLSSVRHLSHHEAALAAAAGR